MFNNAHPALTEDRIVALTPHPTRDVFVLDGDCPGLLLRVYPSGARVWVVRTQDIAGRRVQVRLGDWPALSIDDARTQARLALADIHRGVRFSPKPMTFRDAAEEYFAAHIVPGCKQKTRDEYRRGLMKDVYPILGDRPIKAISTREVLASLEPFMARVYWNRLLKGLLRPIFKFAVSQGYRDHDPTAGIAATKELPRRVDLSDPERAQVVNQLEVLFRAGKISSDTVLSVKLILATGCRVGEILLLQKDQIKADHGQLVWDDTKTGRKTIPLTHHVLHLLQEAGGLEGDGPVLLSWDGKDRHRMLRKDWDLLRRTVGLPDLRLHDLRHLYGTLVRQLSDPVAAMDLLGLRSPEMLLVYARATPGELARIAERAAAAMLAPAADAQPAVIRPSTRPSPGQESKEATRVGQGESSERLQEAILTLLMEVQRPFSAGQLLRSALHARSQGGCWKCVGEAGMDPSGGSCPTPS